MPLGTVVEIMIANRLLAPEPLYRIGESVARLEGVDQVVNELEVAWGRPSSQRRSVP